MCAATARKPGCQDGQLAPCPSRPNCVCSQSTSAAHAIDPIVVPESMVDPFDRLAQVMSDWPRARLITRTSNYLHVEVRTALFRFVDDVEFCWDADRSLIHVRSASRLGYSDLGTNRRRMERIRHQFQASV